MPCNRCGVISADEAIADLDHHIQERGNYVWTTLLNLSGFSESDFVDQYAERARGYLSTFARRLRGELDTEPLDTYDKKREVVSTAVEYGFIPIELGIKLKANQLRQPDVGKTKKQSYPFLSPDVQASLTPDERVMDDLCGDQ